MNRLFLAILLALISAQAMADTVLVTAVQGAVTVEGIGSGKMPLEPFVRLREGDRLTLPAGCNATLVFVNRGRLETWRGAGTVAIGENEGKATAGKPEVQLRQIPPEVSRQMNRTPSGSQDGRVGMMRMRGIPAVARLEREYNELRAQAAPNDITPEVLLLAGLYDMGQYERLDEELKRVARDFPNDPNVAVLQQLYSRVGPKSGQ